MNAAVLHGADYPRNGGIPAPEILLDAFQKVLACSASGKLRIETERVPLAEIEDGWLRRGRSRLVIIP
jgi:hypothetical protein